MVAPSTRFAAPTGSLLRREVRALREPVRLVLATRRLLRSPRGDRHIMVLPGYGTGDMLTLPIRWFLKRIGHRVSGWGLGINRGQVRDNLPAVIDQVEHRVRDNGGRPVTLIGWSLGGVFAREVARERSELVAEVITMATPVHGGPRYTVSAPNYTEADLDAIERGIELRLRTVINRPITAFYTRRDGAVDWRTCIDDRSPRVEHLEVDSSHLGITLDPTVWLEIARRVSRVPTPERETHPDHPVR